MSTLICTVELDKIAGITVKVENADGKITQTVTMDGTTMTLIVAGENDTTTITQSAGSIVLKSKGQSATSTFTQQAGKVTIDCDDLELTARRTITWSSAGSEGRRSVDDRRSDRGDVALQGTTPLPEEPGKRRD